MNPQRARRLMAAAWEGLWGHRLRAGPGRRRACWWEWPRWW